MYKQKTARRLISFFIATATFFQAFPVFGSNVSLRIDDIRKQASLFTILEEIDPVQ